jgi:hypothetical protein
MISVQLNLCHTWQQGVCLQLSTKVCLLIKDAKELNAVAYSEFIAALIAIRKRI